MIIRRFGHPKTNNLIILRHHTTVNVSPYTAEYPDSVEVKSLLLEIARCQPLLQQKCVYFGTGAILLEDDEYHSFFAPFSDGCCRMGPVVISKAVLCQLAYCTFGLSGFRLQLVIPVYLLVGSLQKLSEGAHNWVGERVNVNKVRAKHRRSYGTMLSEKADSKQRNHGKAKYREGKKLFIVIRFNQWRLWVCCRKEIMLSK